MTARKRRVLLVDDDASLREVMRFHLEEESVDVLTAADGDEALALFDREPVPVVVTDLKMPRMDGMTLTTRILERAPETLVVVITAFADIANAVAAMKAGAHDFLPKPFDRDHFKLVIRRAFDHAALKTHVRELEARLGSEGKELLFESDAMRAIVQIADRVAASDVTVLILGESGTGKELLARRIHARSDRASGPFIAVNCGAIPAELLESELFGHAKGAFTGAVRDRRGRFLQAGGGTLFLDEIVELPAELQTRLLRVLQERTVDVVGGDKPIAVDVRVIAATNRDVAQAVRSGELRQDLYFRLNVVAIEIPPLRARVGDVVPLAKRFLREHGGGRDWKIPQPTIARLEAHTWPGNVRELENWCRRVALLADEPVVAAEMAPEPVASAPTPPTHSLFDLLLPADGLSLDELEKSVIERALEMNRYNQSRTARFLRIPRHVLLHRMEKFGIVVPGSRN